MELYKHYKGGIYRVINIARHTEKDKKMVVYEGEGGKVWTRPYDMFFGTVNKNGKKVKRFRKINVRYYDEYKELAMKVANNIYKTIPEMPNQHEMKIWVEQLAIESLNDFIKEEL